MEFDVFFSICQTEVHGYVPDERTMFENFFQQIELAEARTCCCDHPFWRFYRLVP